VKVGVEELARDKLSALLRLKYRDALKDAFKDLGKPEEIGKVFSGFQKYLYPPQIQKGASPNHS
jgi:type I restriction enzyme, R subunit